MQNRPPLLTVFTPTYNRASVLHRVYDSLMAQSFRNFEWLVVDDGSTDDTEALVRGWADDPNTWFPIRYVFQENCHKKSAFQAGVNVAHGELFLNADSDDEFLPDALETLVRHWNAIPLVPRSEMSGVCGLCVNAQGGLVGTRFPGGDFIDAHPQEIRLKHKVEGEKWGFTLTELLRDFPFPTHLPGHVPENVVWDRIGRRYKQRFINKSLRIYHEDDAADAATKLTHQHKPREQAAGMVASKRVALSENIPWLHYAPKRFLIDAAHLTRFALHNRSRKDPFWPTSRVGQLLVVLMAPAGLALYLRDLIKK